MWNKNNSHTHPVHADLPAYCRTRLKNQVKHGRYTIKKEVLSQAPLILNKY